MTTSIKKVTVVMTTMIAKIRIKVTITHTHAHTHTKKIMATTRFQSLIAKKTNWLNRQENSTSTSCLA